jgi:alkanesulfonate monooxygenase SsuD/methylene tetrahydromethanopterin reductase-like flavin-dependent oxidoreductase (luciferase family)
MTEQEVSCLRHTAATLRLGFWAPVYGNWIVSKERDLQNASFAYTRQLTLLAEDIGFATVLLAEHTFNPFDPAADQLDAWTTAAGLATITKHIELMPAVRPAFKHPVVVAKMAGSIDHMSGGRAALNLVSGWWQRECEMMGLPAMPHDERYQRSEEFLTVLKGLWTQHHFSFGGRCYQLSDVTLAPLPVRQPHPTIYLGGESDVAQRLAARLADVYLINGRPVAETKTLVDRVRQLAAAEGREVQFGISAFVICRETREEAQAEHVRLQALRCEEAIPGVDRQVVMIRTYAYSHGYVGSNGGTAAGLVGTPRDIAERLTEFRDIGVTTVLLQFHPMREEMARFGEQVVPLLAQAGIWRHPCRQGGQHNGHNGGVL